MELWVRSQDRETLMIANHLDIYCLGDGTPEYYIEECGVDMGCYKNKERALEVLDEIQEYIEKQGQSYILTDEKGLPAGLKDYGNVYEMPKE